MVYSIFRPSQNHSQSLSAKKCRWYSSKRIEIKCTNNSKIMLKIEAIARPVLMCIVLWLIFTWCIERCWLLLNVSVVV